MPESDVSVNSIYHAVSREIQNETVQELDADTYSAVADFLKRLHHQEFDNVEEKVKHALATKVSELVSLLVDLRLEKAVESDNSGLTSEERYIMDAGSEMDQRREIVVSSIQNGRSKLLESISSNHKTRLVTVRMLDDVDAFMGADLEQYGPYKSEDITTIPYDNAQALMLQNAATRIRTEQ